MARKKKRNRKASKKRKKATRRAFNKRKISRKKRIWISRKIRLLMREGRPQKQAIAIAYRMAGVPRKGKRVSKRKRARPPLAGSYWRLGADGNYYSRPMTEKELSSGKVNR